VDQDSQRLLATADAAIRDVQRQLQALSAEARLLYQQRLSEWEQCRHSLEQFATLLNSQTIGPQAGFHQDAGSEGRTGLMEDEAQLREKHRDLGERVYQLRQALRLVEASVRCLEGEGCRLEGTNLLRANEAHHAEGDWAGRILQAREQERLRLAREIHDGPAQVLANAVFELEYFERVLDMDPGSVKTHLAQLKSDLRDGLTDVRRSIYNLRPPALNDGDLFAALGKYLQDFGKQFGVSVDPQFPETTARLSLTKELAIFRVFQEALQNVQKHAGATRVVVVARVESNTLEISIEDDGRGFDPSGAALRNSRSLGLVTMRERAELIGGQLEVDTSPGEGTQVTLTVPLDRVAS